MRKRTGKPFTIIELLMVISIIVILAALLLPALSKVRETSRSTLCSSNLRQIGTGFYGYLGDYGDTFPPGFWGAGNAFDWTYMWPAMIAPYLQMDLGEGQNGYGFVSSNTVFACPSNYRSKSASISVVYISYGYNYRCLGNQNYASYSGWGYTHPGYPVKVTRISKPNLNMMHVDTSWETTGRKGRYLAQYVDYLRFRHNRKANTLYVDGHVKGEGDYWLYRGHETGYPFNMTLRNVDWFQSERGLWPYGYP